MPSSKAGLEGLDQRSLSERVYQELRASIISGRSAPGERLIEDDLAKDFGVSRAPVREAFRKLASEQLVEERPRHGTYVRKFSVKDFVDAYNLIGALEDLAVRLIVRQKKSLEPLERLVNKVTEFAECGDYRQLIEFELEFHHQLCRTSGNYHLDNILQKLSSMISMTLLLDEATSVVVRQIATKHQLLLDALREAVSTDSEEQAVSAIRSHLRALLVEAISHLEDYSEDSYPLVPVDELK